MNLKLVFARRHVVDCEAAIECDRLFTGRSRQPEPHVGVLKRLATAIDDAAT